MLNDALIESLRTQLESHPIYSAVQTLDDLRVFMQHHVYSAWDFMSPIKYLRNKIAPARPVAAAMLALGREHVIPSMSRAFLSRMAVSEAQARSHFWDNVLKALPSQQAQAA